MLITLMFLVVAESCGCAGAGREQSQAASPGWPMEILHIIGSMRTLWMGVGWGGSNPGFFLFSMISLFLGFWTLPWIWSFLGSCMKFVKSVSSVFRNGCCLYLSPQGLIFPVVLPIPLQGGRTSERLCGPCCPLLG